jgi:hypothetical protein
MIDLDRFEKCVCRRRGVPNDLCESNLSFEEKGKKVRLSVRTGEEGKALAIDQCVCTDNRQMKCDGMFLYRRGNRHWMIMVELKGGDIEHAFEQLAYMRYNRDEYGEIEQLFMTGETGLLCHLAYIVSNFKISSVAQQKLEASYNIRIKGILHSEATTPIPDVRPR